MSPRRIGGLAKLLWPAVGGVVFTSLAAVAVTFSCILALVPTHDLRAVAVRDGALMPELADTLRARGFAVREAADGEGTDPHAGTIVLSVATEPGHPVKRIVRAPGLWASAPFTLETYERLSKAVDKAGEAYKERLVREAGIPPEIMRPVRFAYVDDDGKEDEAFAKAVPAVEEAAEGLSPLALLPRRGLAPTLGLALTLVELLGFGALALNQAAGRLEGLSGTLATPSEVILALALNTAKAAFMASLLGALAASLGLAWYGVGWHWRWVAIPPVAAAFAAALTCCGLAGYLTFRRPLPAAIAGGLTAALAASTAQIPRVAAVFGAGEGWIQSLPFSGVANGLVTGDATGFEILASAATTALLGALAYRRASRLIDARFYLRSES